MEEISWTAEYAAFAIMLGLSVIVGLYYGCVAKQNTVSDYLFGGKKMTVFPITMSLIASHVSGVTLLGVPSEVYSHGTQYTMASLSNALVVFAVIAAYLPVFYELQLTSVFEYLELRFHPNVRRLTSLIYALSLILFLPLVVYVPALAFNQVTGINVHFITTVISVVCIFYTTVGGLKAVVWTDAIQSVFTAIALVFVIVLGFVQVGGIAKTVRVNRDGHRLEFFNMDPNPFLRNTFWTVTVGSVCSWINFIGIHPGAVQRFVSLPSYEKARNSLVYFAVGLTAVKLMTCAIGMLMYAKYQDCDPVRAKFVASERNLLPYFVVDVAAKFPGLTGLFVAGIVSAALSTMSAQLNTVAGTIYEDFIVKTMKVNISESRASFIMKSTVFVLGFICVCLVTVVEKLGGILQISVSVNGITQGATLSAFTLGICFPRANTKGAICGMLASIGVMTWIVFGAQSAIYNNELKFVNKGSSVTGCPANITISNATDYTGLIRANDDLYAGPDVPKVYTLSYLYYSTAGTAVGLAVGLAVSLLFPDRSAVVDQKLLMPCLRRTAPALKSDAAETAHAEMTRIERDEE